MARPNRVEVAAIQHDDLGGPEPLGHRDDGRVGRAKREVGLGLDQLGHSLVVDQLEVDDREGLLRDRAQECGLDVRTARAPSR